VDARVVGDAGMRRPVVAETAIAKAGKPRPVRQPPANLRRQVRLLAARPKGQERDEEESGWFADAGFAPELYRFETTMS